MLKLCRSGVKPAFCRHEDFSYIYTFSTASTDTAKATKSTLWLTDHAGRAVQMQKMVRWIKEFLIPVIQLSTKHLPLSHQKEKIIFKKSCETQKKVHLKTKKNPKTPHQNQKTQLYYRGEFWKDYLKSSKIPMKLKIIATIDFCCILIRKTCLRKCRE